MEKRATLSRNSQQHLLFFLKLESADGFKSWELRKWGEWSGMGSWKFRDGEELKPCINK